MFVGHEITCKFILILSFPLSVGQVLVVDLFFLLSRRFLKVSLIHRFEKKILKRFQFKLTIFFWIGVWEREKCGVRTLEKSNILVELGIFFNFVFQNYVPNLGLLDKIIHIDGN